MRHILSLIVVVGFIVTGCGSAKTAGTHAASQVTAPPSSTAPMTTATTAAPTTVQSTTTSPPTTVSAALLGPWATKVAGQWNAYLADLSTAQAALVAESAAIAGDIATATAAAKALLTEPPPDPKMAALWNKTLGDQVSALQEAATAVQTKNPAMGEQAQADFVDSQPYLQTITNDIQTYK